MTAAQLWPWRASALAGSWHCQRVHTPPGTSKGGSHPEGAKVAAEEFQRAKRGKFFQVEPQLRNPFIEDGFLRAYLTRVMPAEVRSQTELVSHVSPVQLIKH